jgi:threonine dehydrogenase-like Zn-dependent dehydrogenase
VSTIDEYRAAIAPLPDSYTAWEIYGAGFENVGKDGNPATLPVREPADNEVLLRVDALGLCLSDIKIINQGSEHARLRGRDLATEPTVLGHECAATVVKVGKDWAGKFSPGDRFIVQADIYYKGLGYAFGYLIPGGLAEYAYVDERVLDGDEGCYLLPVQDATGYSQSALSEPWACVEMSYCLEDRLTLSGGEVLVVTDGDLPDTYEGSTHVPANLDGLPDDATYDDIIVFNPSAELVETLAKRLNKDGVMFLLGHAAGEGVASLDIGRIHYEGLRFYGGGADLDAIAEANKRNDLLPGGSSLFIGAGGPMGQMHVQRALEVENGPSLVVVTDLDRGRMDHIQTRFGGLAEQNGRKLITLTPGEFESQEAMDAHIGSLSDHSYDDICILAPVAGLATHAVSIAADNALINVFAGVLIGSEAPISVEDLCRGIKIIGSSGSRISDLRKVLHLVEADKLNTNLSVAAIGGMNVAHEGLEGLRDARFPGKTVIYTQIPELPLMAVEEIPDMIPELADKLGPGPSWTIEAETALLELYA